MATASHPDQSSTGHPLPARGAGILGIETSQARGSVAWAAPGSDGTVSITELLFPVGLVHGREILPTIDALSERVPFDREEIGVVAVSVGPGSFTGARIGVAAAKALAWGLCARLLAVSSLEVIARGLLETERDGEPSPLLGAREAPTAIFAFSDEMAFGVLRAARALGIGVPEELSVVGFDDHDLADLLDLTTVRQDVVELGSLAARRVLGKVVVFPGSGTGV